MRKKYLKNVGCLKNGMPILYFLKYSSPCFLKHPAIHIGRGEKKPTPSFFKNNQKKNARGQKKKKKKKKKKTLGNMPSNYTKKIKSKQVFS
jgi:hypothetical protein